MVSTRRTQAAAPQPEQAPNTTTATTRTRRWKSSSQPSNSGDEAAVHASHHQQQNHKAAGPSSTQANGTHAATATAAELDEPLDAFKAQQKLLTSLQSLLAKIKDPTAFLQADAQLSQATRSTAQALYDYGVRSMLAGAKPADKAQVIASLQGLPATSKPGAGKPVLPSLCVDEAFDSEQIWVQLELAGHTALNRGRNLLARATQQSQAPGVTITLIPPELEPTIDAVIAGASDSDESGSQGEGEESGSGDSGDDDDADGLDGLGEQEDDDYDDGDEEDSPRAAKRRKGGAKQFSHDENDRGNRGREEEEDGGHWQERRNPVEDRFLAMKQMERFLLDAERQAAKAMYEDTGSDEDEGEDEDDDLHLMSDSDAEDDSGDGEGDGDMDEDDRQLKKALDKAAGRGGRGGKKDKEQAAKAMYSDFFGPMPRPEDYGSDEEDGPEDVGLPFSVGDEGNSGGDDDEDDGDDDDERGGGGGGGGRRGRRRDLLQDSDDMDVGEDGMAFDEGERGAVRAAGRNADGRPLSSHQKRLLRIQEQIHELEEQALGEKDWHLTGEVDGKRRPLNSALEIDMDFDTTVRPPPEPTEEAMQDLEEMIKKRIAEHRFDDVVRVVPPPVENKRKELELQDTKAAKGLAEEYEQDFAKAVGGDAAAEEEESALHKEAKMLFQALVAKLDALSHFHFAPKPVVEDLTVRSDVAAVAMEEAAPVAVSAASMRLPGEVFKSDQKGAAPKAEAELTKEERKQRRAKRKRVAKAKKAEKESEARARAVAAGKALPLPASGLPVAGRKSAVLTQTGKKQRGAVAGAAASQMVQPTKFGKSAAVFAQIQAQEEAARAGVGKGTKKSSDKADTKGLAGAALKL